MINIVELNFMALNFKAYFIWVLPRGWVAYGSREPRKVSLKKLKILVDNLTSEVVHK